MQQIKCVRLVADIVVVCAKMDQKSTLGFSHDLISHIAANSPALSHAWQVKSKYIPIREKIQLCRKGMSLTGSAWRSGSAERSGAELPFRAKPCPKLLELNFTFHGSLPEHNNQKDRKLKNS